VTDYTPPSLATALEGQDAVVSLLGSPALGSGAQLALIDAAAAAGVRRFIPSEFGHNTGSDAVVGLVPIFGGKRSFVDRIKSHGPGLAFTAVITGLFFDWGVERGTLFDARKGTATVWDDGDVPFSTTNLPLIGRTLVKILTDPAAYADSENKYVYLASHTTTQNQVIAAAEKATGKKFEITKVNGAQRVAEGREKLAKGDMLGIRDLISGIAFAKFDGAALADYREYGIFNDKHGISDVPLEEDIVKITANL
jgi:hypothetical protein